MFSGAQWDSSFGFGESRISYEAHVEHEYSSFVVIKVILGVNLISYATRRKEGMEARAAEDAINDFGRDPIGEGKEEQVRGQAAALVCR